jgi:hypothetical protein
MGTKSNNFFIKFNLHIDLFPPYSIKLCQNIHPTTPLKCDFLYEQGQVCSRVRQFWRTAFF